MACRYCAFNAARKSDYKGCLGAQILTTRSFIIVTGTALFLSFHSMTLTPMQEAAFAAITARKNLLLLSPTGSGKTLGYLLPTLQNINADDAHLQAVVVVPTRELALQVESVLKTQSNEVRGLCLYGGRPAMEEHRRLREIKPQIVFATPGRLLDHIEKGNLNVLTTKMLIVDEYDKCLELGFREEMDRIGDALSAVPQVVLTSATAFDTNTSDNENNTPQKGHTILYRRHFYHIDYLDVPSQQRLDIWLVPSPEKDKLFTLSRLLTHLNGQNTIVFAAHRESAERIGQYLHDARFPVVVYHGGMEQDLRERALYRFRAGAATVLVSTDLAARGLDIPTVRAVVHYHLPSDKNTFIHRSGRTARWQDTGATYLIVGPEEQCPDFIERNELLEVNDITPHPSLPQWSVLYIGRGKKDKLSKTDILGFLCKKGGLRAEQIGQIDLSAHAAYAAVQRNTLKMLLQQVAGEKIKGMKTLIEEMRK